MSNKSPIKLTEQQITKIKSLYAEGKNIYQIHKQLNITTNTVKYHVERVLLAQLKQPLTTTMIREVPVQPYKENTDCANMDLYLDIIEELKTKNKKLIEILALH